jgi:hypothetical protein
MSGEPIVLNGETGSTPLHGTLPGDSLMPGIRGLIDQAKQLGHAGDGVAHAPGAGTHQVAELGSSFSSALHNTLQQSMADESRDPYMLEMQHEYPDQWMKHEHTVQTADLAVQSIAAMFSALDQQGSL